YDRENQDEVAENSIVNIFSIRDIKYYDGGVISPKHYFVLNDNDHNQSDSRRYGLIDKQNIIGDISIKYYPFEAFTTDFK
ncbi:S26 family signal peptidase, partial [Staphylococcus warneri]|uniref:S26 family signal peptidase n=1 Tax=Staphylococcus warneri TaxID=1292 RepID=UPI000EF0B7E5